MTRYFILITCLLCCLWGVIPLQKPFEIQEITPALVPPTFPSIKSQRQDIVYCPTNSPNNLIYSIECKHNTYIKPITKCLQTDILPAFSTPARKRHKTDIPTQIRHTTKRRPDQWTEETHRCAPSTDWRKCEADAIRALMASKTSSSMAGLWRERGPSDVPGRITDLAPDFENDRLYALSDHGIVFISSRISGHSWQALNDRYPLALGTYATLQRISGPPDRLLVAGFQKYRNNWAIAYSDTEGASWTESTGIEPWPIMGIKRVFAVGDTVYAFLQQYNPDIPTDYYTIYRSEDRGGHFALLYQSAIPVGDGGRHYKSDIWMTDSHTHPIIYACLEDSLFAIDRHTGSRTFINRVSGHTPGLCLLSGALNDSGVSLNIYQAHSNQGNFYRWQSRDPESSFQGAITEDYRAFPFGLQSFSCSPYSGDTLYMGGIIISRSTDKGKTWTIPDLHESGQYVNYHGDVPAIRQVKRQDGRGDITLVGTDGGMYRLNTATDHFETTSLAGPGITDGAALNCTQIYKMSTRHSQPGTMVIGTQDNGYATTTKGDDNTGPVPFSMIWGGDVTNIASGDKGESAWVWWWGEGCNYVTDLATSAVSSNWSPYWQNGRIDYWEAPIFVPAHRPDVCLSAGYLNHGSGSHLLAITAVPGQAAIAKEYHFDVEADGGGRITAIAVSPADTSVIYLGTSEGYLYTSSDAGTSWRRIRLAPWLYCRTLCPSPLDPGTVYIGGSGYDNSGVFVSRNMGLSATALQSGLPRCIVEKLALDNDRAILYAATSVGPFAMEVQSGQWEDISDGRAPLVHYMDVDVIAAINTVRFGTYARGVWDFIPETSSSTLSDGSTALPLTIYPNPAQEFIRWTCPDGLESENASIVSREGTQVMRVEIRAEHADITQLPAGVYFIRIDSGVNLSRFVKL